MNAPIRTVIVGLGNMGRRWLRTLTESPRFRVVGVVEPNADAEVPDGIARNGEVDADAAVVATPTPTHREAVSALLRAGCSNILVEKPMAYSSRDCDEMRMMAASHGARLYVGHVERFNPAVRALADVLRSGIIGAPLHFRAARIGTHAQSLTPPSTDVVRDLAVHDIDVVRSLIGPLRVESAACHATMFAGIVDTAEVLLSSERGPTATVHVDWIAPTKTRTLAVTCTRGAAFVDYVAQTLTVVRPDGQTAVDITRAEPLKLQADAFADACMNVDGESWRLCLPEAGKAAVALAERAIGAAHRGWV